MCLYNSQSDLKEFIKRYGHGQFIEVWKRVSILDSKCRAPYRWCEYRLDLSNTIEAVNPLKPFSRKNRIDGGAIHVYLNKPDSGYFWEDRCVRAWAPIHKVIGLDFNRNEAAFPYIIIDDAEMEKIFKEVYRDDSLYLE